jgi:peptidoglycan hydrolase CwlO-like protein
MKMKYTMRIMTLLFTGLVFLSCKADKDVSKTQSNGGENADQRLKEAKDSTLKAAHAVEKYGYARKEQFVGAMNRELADIQSEIDKVSAEIESTSGAAKAEAQEKLKVLRRKWSEARGELDRAGNATEEAWEDVEDNFNKRRGELKTDFNEFRVWMAEKIAPSKDKDVEN